MRKFFFIGFAFITIPALSQNFAKLIPPTPEAAHLQKEIKIPVDYSTGVPNISIPLFEVNTGNISVPISLNYHASGIRVDQLSSSVGLGWGLSAGGAIQRSIRGKSDESGWFINQFSYTAHYVNQLNSANTEESNGHIMTDYDFSQDDYSYNFAGFGGNFFYDSTHTLRYTMREPLAIFSTRTGGSLKYSAQDYSGNKYYFDSTDLSYLTTYASNSSSTGNGNGGVTSWKLTKIKHQEVDSVVLDYEKYNINYQLYTDQVYDIIIPDLNNDYSCGTQMGSNNPETCGQDYESQIYYMISVSDYQNSLVKTITSNDVRVNFYYSTDNSAVVWKKRLDSVVVTSLVTNAVIKRVYLTYSRFSNNQIKLDAVKKIDLITGNAEETKFEYHSHDTYQLPTMGSYSRDLFGYYNGRTNANLISSDDTDYVGSDADRNINPEAIVIGTLQRIIYPTGGYTEFTFEPIKRYTSHYAPGLRLKQMLEYDGITAVLNKTEYEYYHFYGVDIEFPFNMLPKVITTGAHRNIFSSNYQDGPYNNYIKSFSPLVPHGYTYDSVVVRNVGLSHDLKTSYQYDHLIIHDGFKARPIETKYFKFNPTNSAYEVVKKENQYYLHHYLSQHNTPLVTRSEPTMHCSSPLVNPYEPQCETTATLEMMTLQSNINLKSKDIVTTYTPTGSVVEETRYYYENLDHLQPTRVVRLNSLDSSVTLFKYPEESAGSIYGTMVASYIRIPVITEETRNAQNALLSTKYTAYNAFFTGFIAPQTYEASVGSNPLEVRQKVNQYSSTGKILNYEVDGLKNSILWDYSNSLPIAKVVNASTLEVAYSSFESNGNGGWTISGGSTTNSYSITGAKSLNLSSGTLSKTSLPSGDYIVTYWSRSGSMLVNSGTGMSGITKNGWTFYEHLVSGATTITISGTGILDEVRLYPKKSQMTTYTYNPGIGITSTADVADKITYYDYNGSNRLVHIRDADKNILKKYEYHITQSGSSAKYYNEFQYSNFTRNNCPTGYESTAEIAYKVPAGRYSSIVSQVDANAQALAEIANRGQQYVNLKGVCTQICTNCSAIWKRCINGTCEWGIKVYTSSVYNSSTGKYDCIYHWEFSDNYWSISVMEENDDPCL